MTMPQQQKKSSRNEAVRKSQSDKHPPETYDVEHSPSELY